MPAAPSVHEPPGRVVALCGGVGGVKLALGLYRLLGPGRLTVVVNTGDDFEHLGLHVSPDIDTVAYTLGGVGDTERGWGRAGESWNFMASLAQLGGPGWFQLGDRDLALHVWRTDRLRGGATLGEVTADFARSLGIAAEILPMTDDPVRTLVHTTEGTLPFQRYFVERRCEPAVAGITFDGAARARPHLRFLEAVADKSTEVIVLCPSNPYLSVDPILALPGVREALAGATAPVVAVSPVVGGKAIKGPTAKIMEELGHAITPATIAAHYRDFLDGLVIDEVDSAHASSLGVSVAVSHTVMNSLEDRIDLAREVRALAARLQWSAAQRHAA